VSFGKKENKVGSMEYEITSLDHVQLAMPAGEEEAARRFYRDILGLVEVQKPERLARRGGVWFRGAGFQVHLGVEAGFRPARKAHPAFRVSRLDGLAQALEASGYMITWDTEIPGVRRFYTDDPFGNRLEFQSEAA
jgi:catechol 2,3-dioxygenase-like lactoylglutathione lyase family enzyme